jgi:hypothetical protein
VRAADTPECGCIIVPFLPNSSFGGAICDLGLAAWYFSARRRSSASFAAGRNAYADRR